MSFPRKLSLSKRDGEVQLIQEPYHSLEGLRKKVALPYPRSLSNRTHLLADIGFSFDLSITFQILSAQDFGISLFHSEEEKLSIGYHKPSQSFYFDRTQSGKADFYPEFASCDRFYLPLKSANLSLRILADQSIAEVFIEEGSKTLTQRFFPNSDRAYLSLFSLEGSVEIIDFDLLNT